MQVFNCSHLGHRHQGDLLQKTNGPSWISEEVLTCQSATVICVLLIILKVLFWQRYKGMNPSCVSQVTFLVYCGTREGFKTTWNHLYMLFLTMIGGLRALSIACINLYHMYHVWKIHILTAFELAQTYVISRLVCCTTFLIVLMAKCMKQDSVFPFIVSSIVKCLPWMFCNESESPLHSKCSAGPMQYQNSTCMLTASPSNCLLDSKKPSILLHLLISMLLIICGDVELNPGPKQGIHYML